MCENRDTKGSPGIPGIGRDRLMGFAFTAADVLVEAGSDDRIIWAEGSFGAYFARPGATFIGEPVAVLFALREREIVERSLLAARGHGRIRPMVVSLVDGEQRAVLSALALPQDNGHVLLTLAAPPGEVARQPGIGDLDTLVRLASTWLGTNRAASLEVIDVLGAVPRDDEKFDGMISSSLCHIVSDMLGQSSLLAQISPKRFAVLATTVSKPGAIATMLEAELRQLPSCGKVKVGQVSVDLELEGLDARRAVNLLRATLRGLTHGARLGVTSFRRRLPQMLEDLRGQADRIAAVIGNAAFTLAYQPVVRIEDRQIIHYEALIRPNVAGPGMHSPSEFIATAEALGLAELVDLAVVETAQRQVGRLPLPTVAVNISAASIENPRFVEKLLALLPVSARHGVMLEITETVEIEDIDTAQRSIVKLREAGLRICLDDFGSGNASFRYLRKLPVDFVKLDGCYTRAIVDDDTRAQSFICVIRDLAAAVGADIIADKVESPQQESLLRRCGIGHAQGWYYGRPDRLENLTARPARGRDLVAATLFGSR